MSKDKSKKKKKEKKEKADAWRGGVKEAGEYLKNARMAQALKQSDVAEKAGVSQGAVSAAECGSDKISARALQSIAETLGLEVRIVFEKNEKD